MNSIASGIPKFSAFSEIIFSGLPLLSGLQILSVLSPPCTASTVLWTSASLRSPLKSTPSWAGRGRGETSQRRQRSQGTVAACPPSPVQDLLPWAAALSLLHLPLTFVLASTRLTLSTTVSASPGLSQRSSAKMQAFGTSSSSSSTHQGGFFKVISFRKPCGLPDVQMIAFPFSLASEINFMLERRGWSQWKRQLCQGMQQWLVQEAEVAPGHVTRPRGQPQGWKRDLQRAGTPTEAEDDMN